MSDEKPHVISRRDLLRNVGLAGAAAVAVPGFVTPADAAQTRTAGTPGATVPGQAAAAPRREALEHLTAAESDLLEAVVDRLIPADAMGPGAKEARVVHYIDRALGSALASSRQAYANGLASLEKYATASRGKGFLALPPHDQDSVLIDIETGGATGFTGSPAQFFTMVLGHTRQGMFSDPYYGGNANFIGWDLLGYPGVRTNVRPEDQKAYEAGTLQPNHKSAYDSAMFNKAVARVDSTHGSGLMAQDEPTHGSRLTSHKDEDNGDAA
jgi:gluconate 2-dehydrogenase gamma chain